MLLDFVDEESRNWVRITIEEGGSQKHFIMPGIKGKCVEENTEKPDQQMQCLVGIKTT